MKYQYWLGQTFMGVVDKKEMAKMIKNAKQAGFKTSVNNIDHFFTIHKEIYREPRYI